MACFANVFTRELKKNLEDGKIKWKTILTLMDLFLVSFKTIIYRLEEVGIIGNDENFKALLKYSLKHKGEITLMQKRYSLCEQNNLINYTKSFGDFIDILHNLYEKELITEEKRNFYFNEFDVKNSGLNASPEIDLALIELDESNSG